MPIQQNIHLATDAVVFGYKASALYLLLIRRLPEPFAGQWALPGGFVKDHESLEEAVARELEEETGIKIHYLEQLYSFGQPDRDPRRRVVSVAYFGLVNPDQFAPAAASDAGDAQWFPISDLPTLAFDHAQIVAYALQRLRAKLTYEPIGLHLLHEEFLFSELESLYESILNRKIDRSNFRSRIMSFGILQETKRHQTAQKGRTGLLYRFDQEKYAQLKQAGFIFDIG